MEYAAPYAAETVGALLPARGWSCSLFAALGDPSSRLYGRNFDWEDSPAMLLFTDPPNGYASVSMVDIAYLLSDVSDVACLQARPLPTASELLRAPHLPFDGMNEQGLAVGMAAVPAGAAPLDPALPTVDDLELMRWMLDRASTVDEAVGVLRRANVAWGNGPPIHYLIADATGQAALVEYVQGEMVVLPNEEPWHLATNFFVSVPVRAQRPRVDCAHATTECWTHFARRVACCKSTRPWSYCATLPTTRRNGRWSTTCHSDLCIS